MDPSVSVTAQFGEVRDLQFKGWDWAGTAGAGTAGLVSARNAQELETVLGHWRMLGETAHDLVIGGVHKIVALPDVFWSLVIPFVVCGHVLAVDAAWCRECCHARGDVCKSPREHCAAGLVGRFTGQQERIGGALTRLFQRAKAEPLAVACQWHNTTRGCEARVGGAGGAGAPGCGFEHTVPQLVIHSALGPGVEDEDGGAGRAQGARAGAAPAGFSGRGCGYCARTGVSLSVCSRCKRARYCSRQCQLQAFKSGHKAVCQPPAPAAVAAPAAVPASAAADAASFMDVDPGAPASAGAVSADLVDDATGAGAGVGVGAGGAGAGAGAGEAKP